MVLGMLSEQFSLEGRVVGVCTPAYDGLLCQEYVSSLLGSRDLVRGLGGDLWWGVSRNVANHVRLRNSLVSEGLARGVTDFLIVDSDVGWRPEDLVWLLERDLSVVGGVPRVNKLVGGLPFAFEPGGEELVVEGGVMRVGGLPTAFLLVKAGVFGILKEAGLAPAYEDLGAERNLWFEAGLADGRFVSEDMMFCKKLAEVGVPVFAAPGLPLTHFKTVGLEGTLLSFMRENFKSTEGDSVES